MSTNTAGALGAADLGMAEAFLKEVSINPTIEPPELRQVYLFGLPFQLVKNLPCSAGNPGSIPGSGRSPREGIGKPHQYPCLGNPMNRGAWWAAVHVGQKELGTTE